jgi:hypothetical protein
MLSFLKKIFQKEELLETEEVKFNELDSWLENKISKLGFKEEIIDFLNQLNDKKQLLKEKIDALKEAEIDPKEKDRVDEKIKNVVLGHRNNYLREMKQFLDKLNIPKEIDLQKAIKFNDSINKELDILAQKTAKNYQAAQHLFFKPVENVFKEVGEINLLIKSFDKKLERGNLKRIEDISKKIYFLKEDKKRKEKLENELKWKELKLGRSHEGKEKQEDEIKRLKESREYLEFKSLKNKEKEVRKKDEENNDEIHLFFSKLARALRKYEKVSLEALLIKQYLEDAVKAFFDDKELKIVDVLKRLEKSLEKNETKLDDKQKENTFMQLEKVKLNHLQKFLEKGKELKKEHEETRTKLRLYTIDKLIEEAEYKIDHFEEQTVMVRREIEELKFRFRALGGEKLKESLKESIREVLKVEIKIK